MFESAPEEQQQNLAITSFASALALHDHVVFSNSYAMRADLLSLSAQPYKFILNLRSTPMRLSIFDISIAYQLVPVS